MGSEMCIRDRFRLSLRADNADQRLTQKGREIGIVGDERWSHFCEKRDGLSRGKEILGKIQLSAREISNQGVRLNVDGPRRSALDALSLSDFSFEQLDNLTDKAAAISPVIRDQIKKDALYVHYVARQEKDIAALARDEEKKIPDNFDYTQVVGLSNELVSKLQRIGPTTVAQANRIDGMTPSALVLIIGALKRQGVRMTGSY